MRHDIKNMKLQKPNFKQMPNFQSETCSSLRHRASKRGASLVFGVWCWVIFAPTSAHAQFSIAAHSINGGGGTSTGGIYSVSGTMGRADATVTPPTNGQYTVIGGFWVFPQAVQTVGAPMLTIAPAAPGYAAISWTPNTPGFILQETWRVSPANWTNSPSASTNPVTIPTDATAKFFRLRQQ
jgi:hypothetical protein